MTLMNFFKRLFCRHEGKLEHVCDVYGDKILSLPRNTRSVWQCPKCGKYVYKEYLGKDLIYIPDNGVGEVSDGYHTFNELYDHRAKLFAVICHDHRDLAWKSLQHEDGSMYDGMFIVGIDTPLGQATYHYDIDPYWDLFDVKELERAPKWDGHTPEKAINRIVTLKWLKDKAGASTTTAIYLCDRKKCVQCDNPDCHHTDDVRHAKNFEPVPGSSYLYAEKEASHD